MRPAGQVVTAAAVLGAGIMLFGPSASCTRAELQAITRPPDAGVAGDTSRDATADGVADSDGGADSDTGTGTDASDVRAGCPSPVLAAGDSTRTVVVDGSSRSYLLHLPAAYDGTTAAPLILDFHAITVTGGAAREKMLSPYPAVTDPEGVVMAFPQGLPGPSGAAWDVGPCCVNADDVTFVRKLLEDLESVACIDARRIYAVGFSMGGGMAHYLACQAADVFAAVAPASFDLLQENVGDCRPPRPITVISFRGMADTLVPYAGGPSSVIPGMPVTFLGAQGTFQKWAEIDKCTGAASPADGNGCSRYSGCQGGVEVILCSNAGGQEQGDATFAWPILSTHTL